MEEWDSIPTVGRRELNDNERRAFGGFLFESSYTPLQFELIQAQPPLGIQRVSAATNRSFETDRVISEVIQGEPPTGFLTEKELSDRWGFSTVSYTTNADIVAVLTECVYVIEIKTREQQIKGLNDVNEAFGQTVLNYERFIEDYPSVADARETRPLLIAEAAEIDQALVKRFFDKHGVGIFDPRGDGFMLHPW